MSDLNETSLYSNLTRCLGALKKIRQLYKNAPQPISEHLAQIEEVILACQCACQETEYVETKISKTYWYVLDNLIEVSTPKRLSLQLYFCKSPYWEHYDRNMTEIMLRLDKLLFDQRSPPPPQQSRPKSRSTSSANNSFDSDSVENDFGEVEIFKRKFVPFSKVVLDRQWALGWRSKALF